VHLKSGHVAAAGLDVLPVEPPVEPVPELLSLYRTREPWLEGRLVGLGAERRALRDDRQEIGDEICAGVVATPEKIGKIPGQRLPDGWVGFPNWQHNTTTDGLLGAFARWYEGRECETIGINSAIFLGNDSDFDNPVVRDIVIEEIVKRWGPVPIRTRPNSFKILIPLRLAPGSRPVTKIRRTYEDVWGTKGALEILGRGEQWVMEGMHPSGVQFE
jgi:hypothetical protein